MHRSIKCFLASTLVILAASPLTLVGQSAKSTLPPPVHLTSEQDHQRMMDMLHISSIRHGADSNAASPYAANYDESKANPYPNLPDPLVLNNGKKVKTAKVWWTQRRPQIVEQFDREVYGRVPAHTPKVNWEVTSTSRDTNDGIPVITKKLVGQVDNSAYPLVTVDIQLTLTTPANATGPVPVMMEFGFVWPVRPGVKPPPPPPGPTWQQQVLAKGWGYAIIYPYSVQADNGAGLTEGIIGLVNKGQPRKLDDWGALRAWAWGASRALDYFQTDRAVDAKQVGIEGHSRFGKAALVTMAYDPRFAIAYISSSGEGGAKLSRRHWGELLENVAGKGEYHWMAGNFIKYAGPLTVNDLPVDAHELIALCAPRPVFIGGGATKGDGWADARGMFLAAAGAGPVYRLLGKKDMGTTTFPAIETPLIEGDVAFRQHSEGHTPAPNWPTFLTFASRYISSPHAIAPQASIAAKGFRH
ncbi:MAG: acetylxylan esterase [Edaphobacter sp.]